jgi:hypothetical protein
VSKARADPAPDRVIGRADAFDLRSGFPLIAAVP